MIEICDFYKWFFAIRIAIFYSISQRRCLESASPLPNDPLLRVCKIKRSNVGNVGIDSSALSIERGWTSQGFPQRKGDQRFMWAFALEKRCTLCWKNSLCGNMPSHIRNFLVSFFSCADFPVCLLFIVMLWNVLKINEKSSCYTIMKCVEDMLNFTN